MTPTLHHIRHFDSQVPYVHPDSLAARGSFRVTRALNAARFVLETITQAALLEELIRDQEKTTPIPRSQKWGMRLKFWRDVVEEERQFHESSPANPQRPPTAEPTPSSPSYREGRTARVKVQEAEAPTPAAVVIPPTPREATPIDKMVQTYGNPPRQQRYAFSPDKRIEDDEFEPTDPPANPEEAARLLAAHRHRMLVAGVVPPPATAYDKWQRRPDPPPSHPATPQAHAEAFGATRFPGLSGMTTPVARPPVVQMKR